MAYFVRVVQMLCLAIVYVATGKLGLMVFPVGRFATFVWPPSGLSLAALLLLGYRVWPGVWLGALVLNHWAGAPPEVALGIATGNTLEALLGACALRRIPGFRTDLERFQDATGLVVRAALLSTVASATIGVGSLALGGLLPLHRCWPTWRAWWLGDAIGVLVIAPLLLTLARAQRRRPMQLAHVLEPLVLGVALTVVSLFVFGDWWPSSLVPLRQVYMLLPLFIWTAVRYGIRGVARAVLLISAIGITATVAGHGPFKGAVEERLTLHQTFMAVVCSTFLLLGALTAERKRVARERRAILEQLPVILWTTNSDLCFTAQLGAGLNWLGLRPNQLVGTRLADLAPATPGVPDLASSQRALSGELVRHEMEWHGRILDMSIGPLSTDRGVAGTIGVALDVTERRKAENELNCLSALGTVALAASDYQTGLDDIAQVVVHSGTSDWAVILLRTESGERVEHRALAHHRRDELPALRSFQACLERELELVDGPLRRALVDEALPFLADVSNVVRERESIASFHRLRTCSCVVAPLPLKDELQGLIVLGSHRPKYYGPSDLQFVRQLVHCTEMMVQTGRLHRQTEEAIALLSMASHDVRNPLTGINLHVELMERAIDKGDLSAEQLRLHLLACGRHVKWASRLLANLHDISRLGTGRIKLNPDQTDLAAVARESVERSLADAEATGCTVSLRADEPVRGCWDRTWIEQIVSNLLSNAIKYGPGKPIEIEVVAREETAVLQIRDRGAGIASADQELIFNRYVRAAKGEGLGLGLWIVRRIVSLCGGSVQVESRLGEGSTFTVELPRRCLT